MAGMSILRPCLQGFRIVNNRLIQTPIQRQSQLLGQVSVRNGGHETRMAIIPSRFDWTRFKDDFIFYLMLGLVPMMATITSINLFIGPAELSEIPEGYEPKEWEYYKSPIKRWLAKYVYEEPQKEYERTLHFLHESQQKRYWRIMKKRYQFLSQERMDYQGWYIIDPSNRAKFYAENAATKEMYDR
ncbi:NADH dehydrogenase [ubiquinone] 1 beta subcomplex subunit 5, mitochondrial-like [Physella acuta]|uniref:NADH dehydrogenase [ubiquinone] 1 beta subcomplex subunit 5, mitochondrial-like n=1 Tax=Physella acuta TaxID=109671 RepID=UPI0027DD14C6|nr:NADH dehydrogenase [ubiquinone] 1 beta subcomplex subunit 5, mitochondrial-like [Physella acuta]